MDKRGGSRVEASRTRFDALRGAAETIRECRREAQLRGCSILDEVLGESGAAEDWRHYPDGEVYDSETQAQYFYHAHPAATRPQGEHGHFHTFLRAEGMIPGTTPLLLPEIAVANAPAPRPQAAPLKRGERDEVAHLVAVALDATGEPIRLFTTNRWVTAETWYRAEDVVLMLDRFAFSRGSLVDRWLAALIRLYREEIAALLCQRDAMVMGWRRRRRTNVFEDPRLEITSICDIDLLAKLEWVDRTAAIPRVGSRSHGRRLPPMAEGWG